MRRIVLYFLSLVLGFTLFYVEVAIEFATGLHEPQAEAARRRRRRPRTRKLKIINEKKLYERIGSAKGVSDIVDEWMRLNLADARIAPFFGATVAKPERLAKLRRGLGEQICEISDGPCQYRGTNMRRAHEKMNITDEQFIFFSDNLFKSMQKLSVPEREKNELLGRIGTLRDDIVHGEEESEE